MVTALAIPMLSFEMIFSVLLHSTIRQVSYAVSRFDKEGNWNLSNSTGIELFPVYFS